ncbi:MAG: hypothetical protein ABJN34_02745 [Litoreibacter sp.]|uniref:hypothetical protein n=1 Tax=Litoreibacter sp. TaxID=1969459 RepID=UPI0032989EAA
MKVILVLVGVALLEMGCSPINVAVPLSGAEGWMEMLSDGGAKGVPVLSMTW